ncbi:MAG: sugar phosphate isomerase/epimerase [Gammaproteobacteria bacterium]|nr:sugar phosphate isomerase/epimerase [Gammaproteobacteria bacterium]
MRSVSVRLHSCSLRHHFACQQEFDIFTLISLARAQGFDGVNISVDGPGFRHLGGTDSAHFANVRDALIEHDLGVELDTGGTRPQHSHLLLEVAAALGADRLRTYTRHQGTPQDIRQRTLADLRAAAERASVTGVRIVLDNHENLRGHEVAEIVQRVDSDYVRALFDYGNSQMLGEDPLVALQAVLPVVDAARVKDHLLVNHAGELQVQGVAAGDGTLPLEELTRRLYAAGLRQFCFENIWSCVAPLHKHASELPDSAGFIVRDDQPLIDGARLDPESAMAGERLALQRGWDWFDDLLTSITRDEPSASADKPYRDNTASGAN